MPMEMGLRQVRTDHLKQPGETGLQESDYLDRMEMPGRTTLEDVGTEQVRLISLGCYCAPKLSFKAIGRGAETLPFDWMRTRIDGLLNFLSNDFAGFFDTFETVHMVPDTRMTIYRGYYHSFWHDNPTDPAMQERYLRRIERFKAIDAHTRPVLFVRSCSSSDELARAPELLQVLKEKHGQGASLLMIIDFQKAANGAATVDGFNNLLFWYCHQDVHSNPDGAPYCDVVRTALDWVVGRPISAMQFVDIETIVSCANVTHWGDDGMHGVAAFEDMLPAPRLLTDRLEVNMEKQYSDGASDNVILASLGCANDPKRTFQRMGRGAERLPFDWVHVSHFGVVNFLRNGFDSFFQYSTRSDVPNTVMTAYQSPHHSFWHDNPDAAETRVGYAQRIANLDSLGERGQPILFVRAVASTDEITQVDDLLAALKARFGELAYLLLVVDYQLTYLGPVLVKDRDELMVYFLHENSRDEAAPYQQPVECALKWIAGGAMTSAYFPDVQAVCDLADPTKWGLAAYGGVDAFDREDAASSAEGSSSTTASSVAQASEAKRKTSSDCCHAGVAKLVGR